jgi:hypothetical protein
MCGVSWVTGSRRFSGLKLLEEIIAGHDAFALGAMQFIEAPGVEFSLLATEAGQ